MKRLFIFALAVMAAISLSIYPPSQEKCPPGQIRVCETIQPRCFRAPCNPISICHCVGRTVVADDPPIRIRPPIPVRPRPPLPKPDPTFDPKKCRFGVYCGNGWCKCAPEGFYKSKPGKPIPKPIIRPPIASIDPNEDPVIRLPIPRPHHYIHSIPPIRKEPLNCPHGYIVYKDGSKTCFHPGYRPRPSNGFFN